MTAFDLTWGKAWKAGAQLECHEEWKVDKRLKSEEAVIAFNLLPLASFTFQPCKEERVYRLKTKAALAWTIRKVNESLEYSHVKALKGK